MANVYDVGQYITELVPDVGKMKLYKLCYFSKGWSLAWTADRCLENRCRRGAKGPVPVALWNRSEPATNHCGVADIPNGDSKNLTTVERCTIESVVAFYRNRSSTELSEMSHGKAWKEARRDTLENAPCQEELSVTTMREEFTELLNSTPNVPSAPTEISTSKKVSLKTALAVAAKVEKTWNGSLTLLATR